MNQQPPGFVPYPSAQQDYPFTYQSPYTLPGAHSQRQAAQTYRYHPGSIPQALPGTVPQQQGQVFSPFRPAPQQPLVNPTPPASNQAQFRPQQAQAQQNAASTSPPVQRNALAPEPASPAGDDQDDVDMNDDEQQDHYGPHGNDEHGAIFNIPPPPENTYATEEELEKAIHAWSKDHGYELVRRASKRNAKGVLYKRYYHCSKHGKRANTGKLTAETMQRTNRKSGRIDCPMSLAAVAVDPAMPNGQWQIRHRKSHHNHGPLRAVELTGHRRRARTGAVEQAVDGLFAIGTSTANVLSFLQKTHPDGLFTRTDVANMKIRWKKWGTCADRIQRGENHVSTVKYRTHLGMSVPCVRCRQQKLNCGSERPRCGNCQQSGLECEYNHEQYGEYEDNPFDENRVEEAQVDLTTPAPPNNTAQRSTRDSAVRAGTTTAEQTEQILNSIKNFQAEHVKPARLTLESSQVEVLAHSSCGNGDNYKALPTLNSEKDWPAFRDAMFEAAMKENTYDVLVGLKREPQPPPILPNSPEGIDVDLWNEYIRQLAIYHRRNQLLLGVLFFKVGPMFKSRLQAWQNAAQAWDMLEDICAPKGSEAGYRLFNEIHSVTLATSASLQNYISRLDAVYTQFKALRLNTGPPAQLNVRGARSKDAERVAVGFPHSGAEVMSEEMVVFLFLRGLGPEWGGWVDMMCRTCNIGGFGTGERLGWREVCRAAVRQEGTGRGRGS